MAPFKGPLLTSYFASGTKEKQGHCELGCTTRGAPRKMPRTTIARLLKTHFFFNVPKIGRSGSPWPFLRPPCQGTREPMRNHAALPCGGLGCQVREMSRITKETHMLCHATKIYLSYQSITTTIECFLLFIFGGLAILFIAD